MEIRNIKNYPRLSNEGNGGLILLKDNLKQILNCEVKLVTNPIKYFYENYQIDISSQPRRSVYRLDDQILLSCKIMEDDNVIAYLGIRLYGNIITMFENSFFEEVANAVTRTLSDCYVLSKCRNSIYYFNDIFINRLIYNTLCKGKYTHSTIDYLIKLTINLSTITFENEHFSTGYILTKESSNYTSNGNIIRNGEIIELENIMNVKLTDRYNKRAWNIVDGVNSFFLFNKVFESKQIFLRNPSIPSSNDFIDSITMANSLYGHDLAFRTFGHNQRSIINSKKLEYISIENKWKVRNYIATKKYLKKKLKFMKLSTIDIFINKLLYYSHYCSTKNRSSIIWIPEDMTTIDSFLLENSNGFLTTSLNIIESRYQSIISRCLISDGVSIINNEGHLSRFGQIVDLSDASVTGLVGTGETATNLLAQNGVAIKTSADGTIKLFTSSSKTPIQI